MPMFSDFHLYDGLGLAELVRQKEVTPLELLEAAIHRIERLNPTLNAVVHKMYTAAEAQANMIQEGAFAGVPMLLKDLLAAYAGEPLRNGSRFYRHYVPQEDSEIVRRYKRAGLLILGKTNTPELGITGVTEPALFGPTCNPWDTSRTVGGSSGGSAAAVAARMVPIAHGGDGGGSIRIPAACCGIFGLKPTRGRMPGSTPFAGWQDFVVEHVLTRSVRDSAAILDATAGPAFGALNMPPPPSRPYLEEVGSPPGRLRIAYSDRALLGESLDKACLQGLTETVELLRSLGHELVPAELDHIDWPAFARAFVTMLASEVRADIEEAEQLLGRKSEFNEFEVASRALSVIGGYNSGSDFVHAVRTMQRTGWEIGRYYAENNIDVLLTSTLAKPPVKIGSILPQGFEAVGLNILGRLKLGRIMDLIGFIDQAARDSFAFTPNTMPFNLTGQPAMSIPLAWTEDSLPVGMQFVGRFADEATLFRLAGQLEEARPWANMMPPAAMLNQV